MGTDEESVDGVPHLNRHVLDQMDWERRLNEARARREKNLRAKAESEAAGTRPPEETSDAGSGNLVEGPGSPGRAAKTQPAIETRTVWEDRMARARLHRETVLRSRAKTDVQDTAEPSVTPPPPVGDDTDEFHFGIAAMLKGDAAPPKPAAELQSPPPKLEAVSPVPSPKPLPVDADVETTRQEAIALALVASDRAATAQTHGTDHQAKTERSKGLQRYGLVALAFGGGIAVGAAFMAVQMAQPVAQPAPPLDAVASLSEPTLLSAAPAASLRDFVATPMTERVAPDAIAQPVIGGVDQSMVRDGAPLTPTVHSAPAIEQIFDLPSQGATPLPGLVQQRQVAAISSSAPQLGGGEATPSPGTPPVTMAPNATVAIAQPFFSPNANLSQPEIGATELTQARLPTPQIAAVQPTEPPIASSETAQTRVVQAEDLTQPALVRLGETALFQLGEETWRGTATHTPSTIAMSAQSVPPQWVELTAPELSDADRLRMRLLSRLRADR